MIIEIQNNDGTIRNAVVNVNHIMICEPIIDANRDIGNDIRTATNPAGFAMELSNGRRIPITLKTFTEYKESQKPIWDNLHKIWELGGLTKPKTP